MATYRSYTANLLAGLQWARAHYGQRLTEGLFALLSDLIAEGANQATKARSESTAPLDALPRIGQNKNLERYFADTDDTYRDRLLHAFSLWQQAGTKQAVEAALDAFGYPDAQVFEDADWHRPPQPYWSQFWIVFPYGTHTVSPAANTYGPTINYGEGYLYGVTGITPEEVSGLRRLVHKWKPSRSICREFIFANGPIYGTGLTYGASGLVYGGGSAIISGV